TVPILLLVVFAGVFALLGLLCRAEGREYVTALTQWFITAACALGAGKTIGPLPASTGKRGINR
ncbi:hypothetical protein K7G98_36120, partial [Saccharothrix sp. MB29]|nr:hypothetical protein [Saccharothrix sp. MB29]